MNRLSARLAWNAADGLTLNVEETGSLVAPAERLTPELRALLLRFKPDVPELLGIDGPNHLALFAYRADLASASREIGRPGRS